MAASTNRLPGRPRKPGIPGQRSKLGLMVTGEIKDRLDGIARANGRTQSQEAEVRIENSFRGEGMLLEFLDLAFGPKDAGVLLMLGVTMTQAALRDRADWHGGAPMAEAMLVALSFVLKVFAGDSSCLGVIPDDLFAIRYLSPFFDICWHLDGAPKPSFPLADEILRRLDLNQRLDLKHLGRNLPPPA
jgi:hypothetical protein